MSEKPKYSLVGEIPPINDLYQVLYTAYVNLGFGNG